MNTRTESVLRKVGGVLLLVGLFAPPGASAAVLEEVIVTAQKRQQDIQDVGISITAFTEDQLRQLGWTHSTEATDLAPNVQTVQPNGPSSYNLNIRGVVQTDFGDHQEPPVSLYVDEVYISQMSAAGFQMFDLERVEILRGPQGTLFGRNATGGLAQFVTRKPSQQFDAYIEATYGSYDWWRVEGAVGGPLTETVSARASGVVNRHDAYVENRIGRDLNNGDDFAVRGQLLFEPNADVEVLLNVRHAEQDIRSGFFKHRAAFPNADGLGEFLPADVDYWTAANAANPAFGPAGYLGGVPAPVSCPGCDAFGYRDPDDDPFVGSYDQVGFNDFETTSGTATIKWNFADVELTSITDYTTMKKNYQEDSDASPNSIFHFFVTADVDQVSQEIRLSRTSATRRWVVGFYYLNIDGDFSNGGEIDSLAMGSFPGGGLDNPFATETDSYAGFAQLEQDFLEKFTLIGGVRYTREEKQHDFTSNFVAFPPGWTPGDAHPPALFLPGLGSLVLFDFDKDTAGSFAALKQNLWSAKVELDWRPVEDWLVYLSWNRGVKGGGFNAPLDTSGLILPSGAQDNARMVFGDETLDAFEIGFKSLLGEGRYKLNGAFFYYDYSDYQAFQFIGLTQTVFNKDAEIYGADLEFAANPIEGLDLVLGLGLLDTKVKDLDFGFGIVDRDTAFSPDFNISGLARYSWPLGNGSLAVQADFKYLDDHNFNLVAPPVLQEDAYAVANARVSYTGAGERWELAFFVNNLTDEEYRVQGFDVSTGPPVGFGMVEEYYGRPRWFGGSLSYRWE